MKSSFFTNEELKGIQKKISGVKLPNNYRHMKVIDLIEQYGEEKTKKLIEEEIYILKNSMVMFDYEVGYTSINGNEKKIVDFTFKNVGEVMLTSIHDYIGLNVEIL